MLTDKAKIDFENYLQNNDHTPWIVFFDTLPDVVKNSYIIEWLDSVGIFVFAEFQEHLLQFTGKVKDTVSKNRVDINLYSNRDGALKQSILVANDLYNIHRKKLTHDLRS